MILFIVSGYDFTSVNEVLEKFYKRSRQSFKRYDGRSLMVGYKPVELKAGVRFSPTVLSFGIMEEKMTTRMKNKSGDLFHFQRNKK